MFKSILLPLDVEHESSWCRTLPVARDLAKTHGSELHIVGVVPHFGSALVGSFFPDDFEEQTVRDPWDGEYHYKRLASNDYEIISYGPDAAPGGEGDDRDISSKKNKN